MKPKNQRKHYPHGLEGVTTRGSTLQWHHGKWFVFRDGLHVTARETLPQGIAGPWAKQIIRYDHTFQRHKHAVETFYDLCRAAMLDAVPTIIDPFQPTRRKSQP